MLHIVLVFFQTLSITGNSLLDSIIGTILPIIFGVITVPIMNALKKASDWVDARPAWLQQFIVLIIAYILTQIGALAGVKLPTTIGGLDSTAVQTILVWLISQAVHIAQKLSSKTPTGAPKPIAPLPTQPTGKS